jgi:tetratricopeptide (TPR) repeat protein
VNVAVVTPFYRTPRTWLEQCIASVAHQSVTCTHFLVSDGDPLAQAEMPAGIQVLRLPVPHKDTGNAARAIGSVSAICRGFDAIVYLDADNWYEPNHVHLLLESHARTGAAVCSSGRNLYDLDSRLLGRCPEVDGEHFVDTNCLLLTRQAFGIVAAWYLMPRSQVEMGDRVVWKAIKDAKLTRLHHGQPTVNYRTRYLTHYRHFQKEPPFGAMQPITHPGPPSGRVLPALNLRRNGPPQRVSLCMIVKNEESNLAECLRPVTHLVDEIIVVDTGSTDGTRDVACGLGAKVVDFPWTDSFAAARNESLRHATCDWVFWVDADDRFDDKNRSGLQRLFGLLGTENHCYMMKQWSLPDARSGSALVVDHVRLFRRQPGVRWYHRVHEQVLPALREVGAKLVWTDLVIHHLGYRDAAVREHKLERNLRLMLLDYEENPDEPFTLFNLGATYLDMGDFDKAMAYLERCLVTLPAATTFGPKVFGLLARAKRTLGQIDEGLRYCREGKERYPEDAELWFEEGLLCQGRNDAAGAQRCFERILEMPARPCFAGIDAGLRGHLARHHLALAYRVQGRPADAERLWRAETEQSPNFGPAWLGLAEVFLDQKQTDKVQVTIDRLDRDPPSQAIASVLRARLFLYEGNYSAARQALGKAIAQAPQTIWPRLVLTDVLLREGKDLGEAERQLKEILAMDPKQPVARERLGQVKERKRNRYANQP